jgi:hypothetical protein
VSSVRWQEYAETDWIEDFPDREKLTATLTWNWNLQTCDVLLALRFVYIEIFFWHFVGLILHWIDHYEPVTVLLRTVRSPPIMEEYALILLDLAGGFLVSVVKLKLMMLQLAFGTAVE